MTLKEMLPFMAQHGGTVLNPQTLKFRTYLQNFVRQRWNEKQVGVRNTRELEVLAEVLDLLLNQRLGEACDLLSMRFKAIEMAIEDGNW